MRAMEIREIRVQKNEKRRKYEKAHRWEVDDIEAGLS